MSDVKEKLKILEEGITDLEIDAKKRQVARLKAQRKYIRVKGHLRPNDGSMDSQTGKPIKDDND